MTSETTPLPARSLNHLSVLSYLAIGIVVFASSLVTGYLIHSCYRSASRKEVVRGGVFRGSLGSLDGEESGAVYGRASRCDRAAAEVELNPLAIEFGCDKESFVSDNKVNFPKERYYF
jgi:hypothetical protein